MGSPCVGRATAVFVASWPWWPLVEMTIGPATQRLSTMHCSVRAVSHKDIINTRKKRDEKEDKRSWSRFRMRAMSSRARWQPRAWRDWTSKNMGKVQQCLFREVLVTQLDYVSTCNHKPRSLERQRSPRLQYSHLQQATGMRAWYTVNHT